MKKTASNCSIIILVLLLMTASTAGAGNTGMLDMLNMTGARQAAMGEVAQLYDPDPFNLEYNSAMVFGIERGRIGFSHNSSFLDRNTNTLAAIFPARKLNFGVHMRLSSLGEIEARGDIPTSDPDYTFETYDYSIKAFSAMKLMERLHLGLSLGWMMEKIDYHRASSAALGLGAVYFTRMGLAFHASVSNLGKDFSFINVKNDMPTIYRAGTGFSWRDLYLAADYVNIKSGEGHLHLGGEYRVEEILYIRSGIQTGYDSRDFSAGAGFLYEHVRIDYAFVPYKSDLGNSHRFTFTLLF